MTRPQRMASAIMADGTAGILGLRPPPLVLLHGFTGSAESWGEALVAGLAVGGRRVIALDLPGHGKRPAGADEIQLVSVMDLVADCVEGPFDLLGYSMGARLALHTAFRHPDRVRRLVLESGSPGLDSPEDRRSRRASDEALAASIVAEGVEAFASRWAAMDVLHPGPHRAPRDGRRAADIRQGQSAAGLAAALRGLGTGALPSLWGLLPELSVPAGLLVGELDTKFVEIAGRMVTALPRGMMEVVPDAGHTVHLDRPAAWLSTVRRWLEPSR